MRTTVPAGGRASPRHLERLDAVAYGQWQETLRSLHDESALHLHLPPQGQPGLRCDGSASPVIALDLDSTVFPLIDAVASIPGNEDFSMSEVSHWDYLIGRFGGIAPMMELLEAAMHPDRSLHVAPYAGCREVLTEIIEAHNARLVVMTDRPLRCVGHTREYLDHHDLPYSAILCGRMSDKITISRLLGARTIIDDRPSTLEAAHAAGMATLTLAHPYNASVRSELGIAPADDWNQLAPALAAALAA
ncbi:5' nucleotidase, NT5C type [Miltoncostaea oceani]|uniref:5' nucleotidase, NT5C type n=1 Tax=Miltoncostaea oceani TaxID=2843216 RepID=UPI001C3CE083|nr:hypothetical protein [Miltoncostaea oceani]